MERSKKKELSKGVLIYAVGTFVPRILSFLVVPLYTYYISTEDLGVYDVLMATASLLTPIITLQISDAAYKWLLQDDHVEAHIRSAIQVLLINCGIAIVLINLVNRFFPIAYCPLFSFVLVLSLLLGTMKKILRGIKRQKLFAISGIIQSAVFLSLAVFQVVYLKNGIVGLFHSSIASDILTIVFILFAEPRIRVNIFGAMNTEMIINMLKFSVPLIPNYMNWWVMNTSDKYIVNIFLGSAANGILAVSHKFPGMLQTVLGLFNTSWQDVSVAEKQTDGNYNTILFRKLYRFALGLLLPLIPATKVFVTLVMNTDYKSSGNYIAFYYLGIVFHAFSSFYGVGYLRNNQTKRAFSTSVYGAAVNALSHICLIGILGLQAAAVSTFLGGLTVWLIRERQNRNELGILVQWNKLIIITGCAVFFAVVSILSDIRINVILFFAGIAAFAIINIKLIGQQFGSFPREE